METTNTCDQQQGVINKYQEENRDLNNRVIELIETVEQLKLDKSKLESDVAQYTDSNSVLVGELDGLKDLYKRKCDECHDQEETIESFEETSERLKNNVADLRDQNEYMASHIQDLEQEVGKLKMNIGKCVEKHQAELSLQVNLSNAITKRNFTEQKVLFTVRLFYIPTFISLTLKLE